MYMFVSKPTFNFNTGQTPSITIADLKVVYRATFEAHKQWQNVLLELEVSSNDIEYTRFRYHDDAVICYREGLRQWLKGGKRRWGDLVEALSSPTVGRSDIAKEIERDYILSAGSDGVTSKKQISKLKVLNILHILRLQVSSRSISQY